MLHYNYAGVGMVIWSVAKMQAAYVAGANCMLTNRSNLNVLCHYGIPQSSYFTALKQFLTNRQTTITTVPVMSH